MNVATWLCLDEWGGGLKLTIKVQLPYFRVA